MTEATGRALYSPEAFLKISQQKKQYQLELNNLENQLLVIDPRSQYPGVINQRTSLIEEIKNKKIQLTELETLRDDSFVAYYEEFYNKKEEIKTIASSAQEFAEKAKTISEKATTVAEDALETATNAAGIAAAKPFIQHFKNRIAWLRWPFCIWITATTSFFVATIYFVTHTADFLGAPDVEHPENIALFISSKIIVVALLISGMIWCGKLFRDSYDKRGFYQHKIAITKTYQVFMESTQDQTIKDAILKESIKHIFSSPPSANESNKTEIEVIKSIPDMFHSMNQSK